MIRHAINFIFGGTVLLGAVGALAGGIHWTMLTYPDQSGHIFFAFWVFVFGGGMYATYEAAERARIRKKNAHFNKPNTKYEPEHDR